MTTQEIFELLPYSPPFLFVDKLTKISDDFVEGTYRFKENEYFYQGHFKNNPITPGVILIEVMAQIGVVCMGIYALNSNNNEDMKIAFTSSQIDFFIPVYPGEKVTVKSQREYFRFNKLKCNVSLFNEKKELVCRGTLSGIIKYSVDE